MPEYVYALHDFVPEHEDEISFSAGDRIEVIEKDDMYGDGWWQGKNLFGKIGLFPQSYTTSDATVLQPQPTTPQDAVHSTTASAQPDSALQTLKEESTSNIGTPNGKKSSESNDGVMRATMTDVQEAIEQLGRSNRDGNGSFSFASSRATNSDRGMDTDDTQSNDENAEGGESWHKGARSNLAEKARKQQELLRKEQEAYDEELRRHAPVLAEHVSEPPIEFEMSDESEDEHEDEANLTTVTSFGRRQHEHISEEDEDDDQIPLKTLKENGVRPVTPKTATPEPQRDRSNLANPWGADDVLGPPPETARQQNFSPSSGAATNGPSEARAINGDGSIRPFAQAPESIAHQSSQATTRPSSGSDPMGPKNVGLSLPSPPGSQHGTLSSATKASPSEWSVDDVVEWARSKGFDDSVCEKFVEHEITGDVLLELDANILKSELEIHAFGKRTRIVKEISELRRPPSIISSAPAHTRTVSQTMSLPGSAHHSLRSPLALGSALSPESPPHTGDLAGTPAFANMRRDSDPGSFVRVGETEHDASTAGSSALGLGIAAASGAASNEDLQGGKKNRPAHLNLSPSVNSLRGKMKLSPKAIDEERAVMSDTESIHGLDSRSRRRRLFGRSSGSQHSETKENGSKEHLGPATPVSMSSTPGSPSAKRPSTSDGSVKGHQRRKRSLDTSKQGDRLSLFGGSISIPRNRKPAPRVQSSYDDIVTEKEKNGRGISRLYLSGNRKSSSKTLANSEAGSPRKNGDENGDSRVLRKRTNSQAEVPAIPGLATVFKSGQSVLEQIGTPDHNGWLRKKGEHYNTWKLRYFVLKGPHLYYLKSNSKTETKIKGYINIIGYKVIVDENINPGKYGFRLIHSEERTHFFSSDESLTVREWMKALMKATIGRDYTKPVISSCNIPTIPLSVAQTMNPAPRPPSPTQRAATQKALRRENPNQLSTRDARILMGLTKDQDGGLSDKAPMLGDNLFTSLEPLPEMIQVHGQTQNQNQAQRPPGPGYRGLQSQGVSMPAPARPTRETRRTSVPAVDSPAAPTELIRWANGHLPAHLQTLENGSQVFSGLALFRLAESIRGKPSDPPVPDSAFPSSPSDDRFDGIVKLFDLLLDNDVRSMNVSINDVRQGRKEKVGQLLRALRSWEEKRKAVARSLERSGAGVSAGQFMAVDYRAPSMAR